MSSGFDAGRVGPRRGLDSTVGVRPRLSGLSVVQRRRQTAPHGPGARIHGAGGAARGAVGSHAPGAGAQPKAGGCYQDQLVFQGETIGRPAVPKGPTGVTRKWRRAPEGMSSREPTVQDPVSPIRPGARK